MAVLLLQKKVLQCPYRFKLCDMAVFLLQKQMETVKKVTQWPYRCKLCDMAVFLLQKQKEKVKK
jgi:hypothetical protein